MRETAVAILPNAPSSSENPVFKRKPFSVPEKTSLTQEKRAQPSHKAALARQASGGFRETVDNRSGMYRWIFAFILGTLCLAPLALIIVISLGQKIEGAGWEWAFSLGNYQRFLVGIEWPDSVSLLYSQKLFYSFLYAIVAALSALAFAFPFTYLMSRQSRRTQAAWLVFLLSAVSLSEVFVVMGWDILLSNRSGLPMVFREAGITALLKEIGWFDTLRGWGLANPRDLKFKTSSLATIMTMSYLVWPYAVILLYPPLSRLDNSLVEAARTMGASPWIVVKTIVLPVLRVPLLGSFLLLFVFLMGTYVTVTVFAAPAQQTLAVSIYESVRGATLNAPFGAAQAVVLLVLSSICLMLSTFLSRWSEARR
ncbi:MAG: ABC transporter permease [Granulosicoccus sp.]